MKYKKKIGLSVVLIVAALTLLGVISERPAHAPISDIKEEVFSVAHIIDGDTLAIQTPAGTERVRLLGVDAPEFGECYFEEARSSLERLVAGNTITLKPDPLNQNRDEYDRLLRYVLMNDTNINAELIRTGATQHLSWFPIEKNDTFAELETQAREKELGIWSEC